MLRCAKRQSHQVRFLENKGVALKHEDAREEEAHPVEFQRHWIPQPVIVSELVFQGVGFLSDRDARVGYTVMIPSALPHLKLDICDPSTCNLKMHRSLIQFADNLRKS